MFENDVRRPLGLYSRRGSRDHAVADEYLQVDTKNVEKLDWSQYHVIPGESYRIKYVTHKMCKLERPDCEDAQEHDTKFCLCRNVEGVGRTVCSVQTGLGCNQTTETCYEKYDECQYEGH